MAGTGVPKKTSLFLRQNSLVLTHLLSEKWLEHLFFEVTTNASNHPDMMTDKELEDATTVFRSLETGLRGATIYPEDLHKAMKRLGHI